MTENKLIDKLPPRFRRVRRSRQDRMLAGVSGGIGPALGVDPALVRIGFVAVAIIGLGTGALLYAACWLLIPEEN
ncbi:PspC domain-containing protein [Actinoalloteichus hymeniacidonis]|uniref:Phage shock protein C (PspC) family protein n=1 Tax=Actinoalloteichus hymeniacidonis TaxID=340345 RepID=A0AAC9N176_9PSEU|nr:PspC domain-containing protein [Actinoalloteichus hymeniacidonis]AOS65852.1 phage shock protein C (PspC) family protein [Actinoalloteichus hymeniacidonis]MBB5906056.1 phage shock protein PspC (stress-responsive transcriptional regulator) [Actinoalloteichus hymeniacidonis]